MPVIELPNGQNVEFPENMSHEDIKSVLNKKFPAQQKPLQQPNNNPQAETFKKYATISSPFNNLRDLLGGLGKASQNIAGFLGQGGQSIASAITGGYAPKVDINEEVGLGKENPVDLQKMISSKNPNSLLQMIGQYAPSALIGGASIPRQIASQGLYGSSQAKPDERLKEGAISSLGTGALGYGGKLTGSVISRFPALASKLKNELKPEAIGKLAHDAYDKSENYFNNTYNKIFNDIEKRGIKEIPIDNKIVSDMKELLGEENFTKFGFDFSKNSQVGDVKYLRKLQSTLGNEGSRKIKSQIDSQRDDGFKMLDLRRRINNSISNHIKKSGNEDLYDELKNATEGYKNFKELYHSKGMPKNIFDETKTIPDNILQTFSKNSKPMQRFREANPEINKRVNFLKQLGELKKIGIRSAVGSAIAGSGLGGYKYLGNKINPLSND